ncbi:MAG: hypothetical protein ABH862_00970, partial [Candidatus Omnitrophota bacterium]
ICVIVTVVFVFSMSTAYGKVRFGSLEEKKTSEGTAAIKGNNAEEVMSKINAMREARAMFSGYSMMDDSRTINEKFKRLDKR